MDYTTYQIIILLNDNLNLSVKRNILREVKKFIEEITKKIDIKYEETKNLAYKIGNHNKAWFAIMRIKLKSIGSNKRIKEIQEKLNTYEEIIEFKIVQNVKSKYITDNTKSIFLIYEFDYGNALKGVEPNITIFNGYSTREKAEEKAEELLQEGLETYFIDRDLSEIRNPFKNRDEVHLYEKETSSEQINSVYYIKIEKIKID